MSFIAVDIGNTRMKFGLFAKVATTEPLPQPSRTLDMGTSDWKPGELSAWLSAASATSAPWWIASVQRTAESRLVEWLKQRTGSTDFRLLTADQLPLVVRVDEPAKVGIDRLAAAVAVNCLRESDRPAIVIDLGTATTIDALGGDGSFLGGAILPGIGTSARALHEFTNLLPLVDMSGLSDPPPAVGTSTTAAMRSGLFWGAIGAIREVCAHMADELAGEPQVFMSGGAAPAVAEALGDEVRYVPHLVMTGVAIAAQRAEGHAP